MKERGNLLVFNIYIQNRKCIILLTFDHVHADNCLIDFYFFVCLLVVQHLYLYSVENPHRNHRFFLVLCLGYDHVRAPVAMKKDYISCIT